MNFPTIEWIKFAATPSAMAGSAFGTKLMMAQTLPSLRAQHVMNKFDFKLIILFLQPFFEVFFKTEFVCSQNKR